MRRVRLWLAEKLLAAASFAAGEHHEPAPRPREDDEDDGAVIPVTAATLSPAAVAMLLEGEAAADAALEKELAERSAAHEPEPARAGSLQERIETARRNA